MISNRGVVPFHNHVYDRPYRPDEVPRYLLRIAGVTERGANLTANRFDEFSGVMALRFLHPATFAANGLKTC